MGNLLCCTPSHGRKSVISWIRAIITNLSRSIPSSWFMLGQSVCTKSFAYEPVEWWDRWERVETCVLLRTAKAAVPHGHSSLALHIWHFQRYAERLEDSLCPWWDCRPSRPGLMLTSSSRPHQSCGAIWTDLSECRLAYNTPIKFIRSTTVLLLRFFPEYERSRLKVYTARKCCNNDFVLFRSRPWQADWLHHIIYEDIESVESDS